MLHVAGCSCVSVYDGGCECSVSAAHARHASLLWLQMVYAASSVEFDGLPYRACDTAADTSLSCVLSLLTSEFSFPLLPMPVQLLPEYDSSGHQPPLTNMIVINYCHELSKVIISYPRPLNRGDEMPLSVNSAFTTLRLAIATICLVCHVCHDHCHPLSSVIIDYHILSVTI